MYPDVRGDGGDWEYLYYHDVVTNKYVRVRPKVVKQGSLWQAIESDHNSLQRIAGSDGRSDYYMYEVEAHGFTPFLDKHPSSVTTRQLDAANKKIEKLEKRIYELEHKSRA